MQAILEELKNIDTVWEYALKNNSIWEQLNDNKTNTKTN
jgi:hypothetical protein